MSRVFETLRDEEVERLEFSEKEAEYFEKTTQLTKEEEEQLTLEKRTEEAESRDRDIEEGWTPEL